MPIRKEFRHLYGTEWRKLRAKLIQVNGPICAQCGRVTPKYLNLSHDYRDPRIPFVSLRCPQCHGRYDAKHSFALRRRTRAARTGQLWLSDEIENAPNDFIDGDLFNEDDKTT